MSAPAWDAEVDVLVVGFGCAGASAAIAARQRGREVLVVEKTAAGGGNAPYSGGFLFDVPDPYAAEHIEALCFGRTDPAVIDAYVAGLHQLDAWLVSLGGETERFAPPPARLPASFPSWPHLPAGERISYRVVSGGEGRRGVALWDLLERAAGEHEVEVAYETAARRLVRGEDGAVEGLVVAGPEGERAIRARGGVVIACGGFEADPGLADAYLPLGPTYPVGHPANDGDGLRLAAEADAALWHMYGFFGWFAFRAPEFAAPFAIDFFAPSFLFVDADGHRFGDETGYEVHDRLRALANYLPDRPNRPRLPSFAIFDDAARLAGPLNGLLGTPNEYEWSADNSAEVERGWIARAAGPGELAAKLGIDPETLAATLRAYEEATREGRDEQFGRAADTLVPLSGEHLYGIETWPGVAGTTGGPRHDARARVLRADGSPVPGLYAAGAVSMVWGYLIDHGGGLTNALVFGRVAGEEASR